MISGLILAGGAGSRMGGQDKGLLTARRHPLIYYVIQRFQTQVDSLAISANRNLGRYREFKFPVLTDQHDLVTGDQEYLGPLAGIHSGLSWCATPLLAIVPCDSPQLPENLVTLLHAEMRAHDAEIAMASANDRPQPVFALLRQELVGSLAEFLSNGERKIGKWYRNHRCVTVDFGDDETAFMNINDSEQLGEFTELIA